MSLQSLITLPLTTRLLLHDHLLWSQANIVERATMSSHRLDIGSIRAGQATVSSLNEYTHVDLLGNLGPSTWVNRNIFTDQRTSLSHFDSLQSTRIGQVLALLQESHN